MSGKTALQWRGPTLLWKYEQVLDLNKDLKSRPWTDNFKSTWFAPAPCALQPRNRLLLSRLFQTFSLGFSEFSFCFETGCVSCWWGYQILPWVLLCSSIPGCLSWTIAPGSSRSSKVCSGFVTETPLVADLTNRIWERPAVNVPKKSSTAHSRQVCARVPKASLCPVTSSQS